MTSSDGGGGGGSSVDCYLHSAAACLRQRDYSAALVLYMRLAAMAPDRKAAMHDDVALALREWSATLEAAGRDDDALACHVEVCRLFPASEILANNLGAQLFRSAGRKFSYFFHINIKV